MVEVSLQLLLAIIFVLIGAGAEVTSFVAPYWNNFKYEWWGLWLRCDKDSCSSIDEEAVLQGGMKVGRACQCLGVASYIFLIVCVFVYTCCKRDQRIISAAIILAFLSLFSVLIGAIMWASSVNTTLSWCYYICYISGLAVAAAGGFLIHCRRQDFFRSIEKSRNMDRDAEDV